MSPQRIQRQRTKGWRMPEGAIYVGRPSRWGNPFKVGGLYRTPGFWKAPCSHPIEQTHDDCIGSYTSADITGKNYTYEVRRVTDRGLAVELFAGYVAYHDDVWNEDAWSVLGGRDLVCWCPLSEPCHADVLLDHANPGAP